MRHVRFDSFTKPFDLSLPFGLKESKMHTNRMHGAMIARDINDSVEESAFFELIGRDVDVFDKLKWIFAEDGVAVVTGTIDRIFSISDVRPNLVRKIIKLRLLRPVAHLQLVAFVFAQNFLQKNEFRMNSSNRVANSRENKAAVRRAKPFVDIVRKYSKGLMMFMRIFGCHLGFSLPQGFFARVVAVAALLV